MRDDLLASLRTRQLNHKFLYDSLKQTRKWLALHEAYSPSRRDTDCAATYDRSFAAVAAEFQSSSIHLVGLGCGGGQKDTRLLKLFHGAGKDVFYTPTDVSTAMVLVARQEALSVVPTGQCLPLVCDLATADDLPNALNAIKEDSRFTFLPRRSQTEAGQVSRLFTCFGMLPNFEPNLFLSLLAGLIRPTDCLLLSANLAPGPDYRAGVQCVLPLYDNALTRDWLIAFLLDLGVEREDGEIRFEIESVPGNIDLLRITARFHFLRERQFEVDAERFEFRPGDSIRLFFSCRHTPALVRALLARYGMTVRDEWITKSGEEGVFLVSSS